MRIFCVAFLTDNSIQSAGENSICEYSGMDYTISTFFVN
jgi:hypothetical protein